MSPKIGITFSQANEKMPSAFTIGEKYLKAILDNGGIPIAIPATGALELISYYADIIDGLLIPGGEDLNPFVYGEEPVPQVTYMNIIKDEFEIALIREVAAQGKPIMGICRGMQIINVAFGGTLIQDIPSQTGSRISHRQSMDIRSEPTHTAMVEENSLLHMALGKSELNINSYHHQAVKDVADGFIVTARSKDGIIEAIECRDKNIFCVQWHPEAMYERFNQFSGLFKLLCNKASI